MIIDQFNADSKKDKKREFTYSVLPGKDRHLKFEKKSVQVCIYLLMIIIKIIHIQE